MWEIFAIEGDEKKRTSFGKTVSNNGFKDVRKGKENKKTTKRRCKEDLIVPLL